MNQESTKAGRAEQPNGADLEAALTRGLADIESRRVRPIEDVQTLISKWALSVRTISNEHH